MGLSLPTFTLNANKRIIRYSFVLAFALIVSFTANAQQNTGSVGIGTATPSEKAILEIKSDSKGLLIPRLTQTKRDELLVPLVFDDTFNGMLVFNTDSKKFNVWKDDNWVEIAGSVGATGAPGATWFSGTDVLSISVPAGAKVGDYYLKTDERKIYKRDNAGWVFHADFAAGPKGDKGDKGDQGIKGNAGQSAYELWKTIPGNELQSDIDFLNSLKGQSAYKLWESQPANTGKTESQFLASLKGDKGDTGVAGQTAYQLWVSVPANAGKTEAQFLASLKGDKGDAGTNGKSAYQLWLDAGNIGTEAQFLASLKGDAGTNGKSTYQSWLDAGNVGTEAQFIASLKGADGTNGKSAYQSWLDAGNVGTEAQFLVSLEGADGTNGKSAYQSWLDAGNVGTEAQFLTSLKGADGALNAWSLSGNSTIAAGSFLGTTDNNDLIVKTDNTERLRIKGDGIDPVKLGNVGINTNDPGAKLEVNGDVIIGQGGTPINQVLRGIKNVNIVPNINASNSGKVTLTIQGAATTGSVSVSPTTELPNGIIIAYARVVSQNTVEVKIHNLSGAIYAPASLAFNVTVIQ